MFRIGLGQDSHRISEIGTKPIILGKVKIEEKLFVESHSDGDVVLHAIFNAISSALGKKSIGFYYPNKDPRFENYPSEKFFETINNFLKESNYEIESLSICIECKKPKIEPIAEKMKQNIAKILQIKEENIGITATSGEKLTAFGKGEGIQVIAVCLLVDKKLKEKIKKQ